MTEIASAHFPNVYLRMDGSGVGSPSAGGGGTVNCQFGAGSWEEFRLDAQDDGTTAIASAHFPNVYLRMDGSNVKGPNGSGGGAVNCQEGVGPWEKFRLEAQDDGTTAIASAHFPNVYLRMDGNGIDFPLGSGGGTVNCQEGVGPWEKFKIS